MPFCPCPSGCGRFLSADDRHDRCLQCLGRRHAEAVFVDDSCVCCGRMSKISLRSRLSFMKGLAPSAATRADLSGSSRGSPADALGDLRVTVRASPLGTPPRTSYSSRSEHPVRFSGDFAGLSSGAPSISFGAPSVDRMSIAASGDGFTSSEDEGAVGLPPSGVVATATPDPELTAMLARAALSIGLNRPPSPEPSRLDNWFLGDTVEGFAQQFSAVQQQTEAIQHILPRRDAPSTAAPGARPPSARRCGRPPELLRPRPNRHIGRCVEPLAGERRPPHPSQAPSRPGSRRSGPDAGNPEMLEFALSQETARTAPLLPPVEGREENLLFRFVSVPPLVQGPAVPTFSKKEQFPFPPGSQVHGMTVCDALPPHSRPRPILPVAKRVRFGDDIPPHAPLASPVRDPGSSVRTPQNTPPSVSSTPTPFCCTTTGTSIVPLEPLAQRLEAWLTLPSLSRWLTRTISTRLRDSVRQATSQVQWRSRDVGGSPERPCLARGDCCPPGKGCNRAGPSSRDEAGVLQPLLHRTQERWWPSANPGSASLEPGFAQAPVQDADAQAHDQMHSAPGLVCSDRPEGHLLSRFDPSATQTVSTVCVRRSGMAVQGPPLRALPVSPCVHEGCRGRPYPVTGSGRQDPQLPRWLAYSSPIQRAVGRSQGLGAPAP